MSLIQYLLLVMIIILAVPIGCLLGKITKEELKSGRKAFKTIIFIASAVIILAFLLKVDLNSKIFLGASMLFFMVLALISLKMSYAGRNKKKRKKSQTKRK